MDDGITLSKISIASADDLASTVLFAADKEFFIARAFVETLKDENYPVIDVSDAVSMSVIVPLSEKSIKLDSASIKIPDFTRGKWKNNKPIFGLDDRY